MTTTQQLPNLIRTETRTYTNENGEVHTYELEIIELEINLNRETRKVEFKVMRWSNGDVRADNSTDFFARIGNGQKSHACMASAWLDNGAWVFSRRTTVLNRNASVVGFRDQASEYCKSQHKGSKIKKGGE